MLSLDHRDFHTLMWHRLYHHLLEMPDAVSVSD
ncbi:hypothetical protein VPHF99_0195 [Vibrio phage F99]